MPSTAVDRPEYRDAQQSIHIAEVDLNYTQYFPTHNKDYQPLFPPKVPAVESFNGPRPPLWAFIEKCMEDGRLEAFKEGALDDELAEKGLALQPRLPTQEYPHRSTEHQQRQRPGKSQRTVQELPPSQDNHERFYVQLSPDPQLTHREHDESEGTDDGVMLNLETNEQESGEISETTSMAGDKLENEDDSGPGQKSRKLRMEDPGDANEEVDAMADYADEYQAMSHPGPPSPQSRSNVFDSHRPETLAELDDEELNAQLRYFYITQDPHEIDLRSIPVRCLVCARAGHMAQECPALTCADCSSYNEHFVPFCPQKKKCSKCRGLGHESRRCPSKLKLAASEIVCDLCQDNGHTEYECELLWRTSGPPKPLDKSDSRWKYIYCYECGRSSHLGNDCPTRRPGKPMGTRTWSLTGNILSANQSRIHSKTGLAIKGRAQQRQQPEPITIDSDSDDEPATFVRPKVPALTRKGSIHIAASGQSNSQPPRLNPMNETYRGPQRVDNSNSSSLYYVGDLDTYRNVSAAQRPFEKAHDQPYWHPDYPGTRSRPNPIYEPPSPPERQPTNYPMRSRPERGETYRPMPSAGQNAWRQHSK